MFRDKIIIVIFTAILIISIITSIVFWKNPPVVSNIAIIWIAASVCVIAHSVNRLICENRKHKQEENEEIL